MDRYITISVDDGHPDDVRTAELLSKYNLAATFYIPAANPQRKMMNEAQIRVIADASPAFEMGAHTYSHVPLNRLPYSQVYEEMVKGKEWLEQVIGAPVTSFCYPKGKFTRETVVAARAVGFRGARTCMFNLNSFARDPMLWGVSTHAYSHSRAIQIRHCCLERNFRGLVNYFVIHRGAVDWVEHFRRAIDYVQSNSGIAHLYLHSWEISNLNEWRRLRELFVEISSNSSLTPVTNGQIFDLWYARRASVN